jgi:internalin A
VTQGHDEAILRIHQAAIKGSTRLSLRNLDLDMLPESLGSLADLTALDLSGNQLTQVPEWIGSLTSLTSLDLSNQERPLRVADRYTTQNRLSALPGSLGGLTNLTTLSLARNQLTQVPDWLGNLTSLTALDLGGNQLSELPESLGGLANLTALDLGGNQLSELPEWLGALTSLTSLDLSGNQLTKVPEWIGGLTGLTTLHLGAYEERVIYLTSNPRVLVTRNQLTQVPDWLGNLTSLTALRLGRNQLTQLPKSLGDLVNLTTLDLGGNQLSILPKALGRLTRLAQLRIYGNWELVSPPPGLRVSKADTILEFLRAGAVTGAQLQWRGKLIVVGDGEVGKTSLVRALAGQSHDAEEPTTHGMRVQEVALEHPVEPGVEMRLSAWDFGGQQVYHATHQFFLTRDCVLVLVWNARAGWERCRLRYWLDLITARAPHARILLVATHGADRAPVMPPSEFLAGYPQVTGRFTVDCKTGAGVAELRQEVAASAAALPHMGTPWPRAWLRAMESCRASGQDYLSRAALGRLLAEAGVDEREHWDLAGSLKGFGEILPYDYNDIWRPDDMMVVLRPEWLSTCISAILDSAEVASHGGLLTKQAMVREWAGIERGIREQLLDLMERFDLCYRIADRDDGAVAVVVDRLPQDRPADLQREWDAGLQPVGSAALRMRYTLGAQLPPGIPTWFIAREHRFATGLRWRAGVLLRHDPDGHLALVTADEQAGTVDLEVRGPRPAPFFWLLEDGLAMTFARYPGLTVSRHVPCPCPPCQAAARPHLYDYGKLAARLQRGRRSIECPESDEDVDIAALLYATPPSTTAPGGADLRADELDAYFRRVLDAVGTGTGQVLDAFAEASALTQRSFAWTWQLLCAQHQARCPSVFTLTPARKRRLPGAKGYTLRLYCEEPGAWHPLPGEQGCYKVTQIDDWLSRLAAPLSKVLAVLQHAAPFAGPVMGIAAAELHGWLKEDVAQMRELLAQAPPLVPLPPNPLNGVAVTGTPGPAPQAHAYTDADFRAITDVLRQLDPHSRWAGLSRHDTPEGLTLYLCPDHLARYQAPALDQP